MKKLLTITIVAVMLLSITSCAKRFECDLCGEMKKCQERTSKGEIIHVCHDCLEEIEGHDQQDDHQHDHQHDH